MKKEDYINALNSTNNTFVENYVKSVYEYMEKNYPPLPFRLPSDLHPKYSVNLELIKNRFLKDGFVFEDKSEQDYNRSYTTYTIK